MPQKRDVLVTCETCSKSFLTTKTERRRGSRFCSISCSSKRKRINFVGGRKGEDNNAWKGGLTKSKRGYWYVLMPEHPKSWKSGYVKRATIVAERSLGRLLNDDEVVHHINGDKEDDSPDNLEVMTVSEHNLFHGMLAKVKAGVKERKPDHPNNRRYSWPEDSELLGMRERLSLREMAKIIGCNHKVVDRRLQKIQTRSPECGSRTADCGSARSGA